MEERRHSSSNRVGFVEEDIFVMLVHLRLEDVFGNVGTLKVGFVEEGFAEEGGGELSDDDTYSGLLSAPCSQKNQQFSDSFTQ